MKRIDLHLSHHRLAAVFWLVVATGLCVAILAAHMLYTRDWGWGFLLWNLFLAWVPLGCALMAERSRGLLVVACGAVWLLFFPNAPYILTDLVHLGTYDGGMFWWVNLIMILSFAMTGLLLGYLSLYVIQKRIAQRFGSLPAWAFALVLWPCAALVFTSGAFCAGIAGTCYSNRFCCCVIFGKSFAIHLAIGRFTPSLFCWHRSWWSCMLRCITSRGHNPCSQNAGCMCR